MDKSTDSTKESKLDVVSTDNIEIEESLLLRSHSKEVTKELLATRYSLTGQQKPVLVLSATQGNAKEKELELSEKKAKRRPNKSGKAQFSSVRQGLKDYITKARKSRRKIINGLNNKTYKDIQDIPEELTNEVPKYEDFQQLHTLWRSYISDLIYGTGGQQKPASDASSPPSRAHDIVVANKLATADFHGAQMRVVSSHNPTLVGVEGIVAWDARASFVIITKQTTQSIGGLKIINKKGTRFRVRVYTDEADELGHEYEIIGSRIMYRTADRANKKFKTHNVDDL